MQDVGVVVARYNENLNWLNENRDYNLYIYNKGHSPILSPPPKSTIVPLPNVGRESHTYLTHIIDHYDSLNTTTVFVQGNISDHIGHKMSQQSPFPHIDKLMATIRDGVSQNTFVTPKQEWWAPNPSFRILEWRGVAQGDSQMPFGDWFTQYINPTFPSDPFRWYPGALFAVNKHNILRHPKSYYEALLDTVSRHIAPEAGHYLERSWYYIFPGDQPKIL
jgi:hypothetical protein